MKALLLPLLAVTSPPWLRPMAESRSHRRAPSRSTWFGLSFPAPGDGDVPFVEPWLQLVVKGAAELKQALALLTERFDVVGELKRRGADANAHNAAGREPRVQANGGWD